MENILDQVHINFDKSSLWTLNVILAFIMFGVALELKFSDFKQIYRQPKVILTGVISQFVLLPFATFIFINIITPLPSVALGMFMVAACPGGNVSNFITQLAKGNTALSITMTAISTLAAVFMTPLNLSFWAGNYKPTAILLTSISINYIDMVLLGLVLLVVPLALGMWLNYKLPKQTKKIAKWFKRASLLFFVVLIFMALYKNKAIFLDYVSYVFWLVLLHNAVALSTGFSVAKLMGLNSADVKSITIETGIQNSGLGLLLIFTFFDGLGGMALLTAFWGIWHLVSGLLIGGIWGRYSNKNEALV
ncbi:bile acid:sodium symporter family protein [Croceivirga sp. JEA036]|uniref:bile acid:sodium symporter family protein n=1 Tax=Croceivirga sp. JEA036 TaxID=2721162 RepID=UPI00143B49E5|nr:bile acid:sodium symporter family protein [Croceivirga sp. JEA036]NJB37480.1 bile acid:sodium symporter family protein [Croceivirga sp. JEA036]